MTTKKTVTVMAYSLRATDSPRAFAERIDPKGRDMFKQEEQERSERNIRMTDEDGEESSIWLNKRQFNILKESGAIDPENEQVSLVKETETKVEYETSLGYVASNVASEIAKEMPSLDGLEQHSLWEKRFQNDLSETKVRIRGKSFDTGRIFKHQSARQGSDRFEGDDDVAYVQFELTFDGEEDEVNNWSETLVPAFIKELNDMQGVGKVRMTDCKETVEREGDCFNAL